MNNNTLKDELTDHIINAIERRSEQDALKELQSVNESEFRFAISREPKIHIMSPRLIRWWVVAISSAAAVIILVWVGFQPKYSTAELYQSYGPITVYEPAPPSRGEDYEGSADLKIYEDAIGLIQSDKINEAIEKLIYLADKTSFKFNQNAKWELALAYLKTDKRADAKRVLVEISEGGGEYSIQAVDLLQKIKTKRWF